MRPVRAALIASAVTAFTLVVGIPVASASLDPPGASSTGGAWIISNDVTDKATLGFNVGVAPDGSFSGQLQFVDHGVNVSVKSTSITTFFSAACTALFEGTADVNGVSGSPFQVFVTDVDEPGSGRDTFTITLDSYANSGLLGGGNIQVHGPGCP